MKNSFICKQFLIGTMALFATIPTLKAETGDVLFSETFDTQAGFDRFTVLDLNGDGTTWIWAPSKGGWSENYFWAEYMYSSRDQGDDWLITPELQLQKGKVYSFRFRSKPAGSNYYTEVMSVAWGQGDDPRQYALLEEEMLVPVGDWKDYEYRVAVNEDGLYRFAFQALSPADQYAIYVDDVVVQEQASSDTPAAPTGLTATPASQGLLQATLTFTLPSKLVSGEELTGINKAEILRDDVLIATLTDGLTPGAEVSYEDTTPQNGLHTYSVVVYNNHGAGLPATTEAYVGVDRPSEPTDVTLLDYIDHYTLSWTPPTHGAEGHFFSTEGLVYDIYVPSGSYLPDVRVAEGLTSTSFDTEAISGEQTLTRFRVKARNVAGESDFQNSNVICIGTPYELPVTESFANGEVNPDHYWWLDAREGQYWHINKSGSSDNDGACMVWTPWDYYDEAWLNSGKLNLKGTVNPKLSFDYNVARNSGTKIQVEAVNNLQQTTIIGYVDGHTSDKSGWAQAEFSLTPVNDEAYVMVKLHGIADDEELVAIDNIKILDYVEHNLAASLKTPASAVAGKLTDVSVGVHNYGENAEEGFHVLLYANGKVVADSVYSATLPSVSDDVMVMQFTPSRQAAEVEVFAEVVLQGDQVESDNRTKTELISIMEIDVKTVTDLAASATTDGVTLTWTAPELSAETITDSFEDYPLWANDHFGDWRLVDIDDAWSLGFNNYTFPEMEEAYAYIVFNPAEMAIAENADENTVPASDLTYLKAHSGQQYLAAFAPKDDMGVDRADDWLISPRLNGDAQTIKFWAKSLANNGWEHYEVLYSSTDTQVGSFTVAKAESRIETTAWTEIEAQLPAGALHFAIRHMTPTELGYGMFIDDATFTVGDGQIQGYNVYRNEELVATLPSEATSFEDPDGDADSRYRISVLYHAGESPLSNEASATSGITLHTTAPSEAAATYGVDGRRQASTVVRGVTIQRLKDGTVRKTVK